MLDDARPDLAVLLVMTDVEFRERYKHSAVRRATLAGLQRNACIAMGNLGQRSAVPHLVGALGHAAWALGRLGGAAARNALSSAAQQETDPWVREEIALSLQTATDTPAEGESA